MVEPRVDPEQPQRHGGDEQRGQPGRHGLLAHAHHAVSHQQQDPDDRAARPLRAGGPAPMRAEGARRRLDRVWPLDPTPGARDERRGKEAPAEGAGEVGGAPEASGKHCEREHDQAGHQVPGRRHQQRRHRLHPDPDGQVGAAPHHPDDEQAGPGDRAGPPRRSGLFLIPNDPGCLRSGPLPPFRGLSHGRVPLTHDHQACQLVTPADEWQYRHLSAKYRQRTER